MNYYTEVSIPIDMRYIKTRDKLEELMNDRRILKYLEYRVLYASFFHSDIYDLNDPTKYFIINPVRIFGRVESIDYDKKEVIIQVKDRSPYVDTMDCVAEIGNDLVVYPRLQVINEKMKLIAFDIGLKANSDQYKIQVDRGFRYENNQNTETEDMLLV